MTSRPVSPEECSTTCSSSRASRSNSVDGRCSTRSRSPSPRASFTGLIGSNGAGKTTLLRAILGLTPLGGGQIHMAGGKQAQRNRLVGYVPQKIALEPDMPLRARDLVGLGLDGHRFGVTRPSSARKMAIDEMLEAVNATAFAGSRVGNLSGGEQQRIMIAHALVSRPTLLLLDEPLANLDIRSGQEVIELLARSSWSSRSLCCCPPTT